MLATAISLVKDGVLDSLPEAISHVFGQTQAQQPASEVGDRDDVATQCEAEDDTSAEEPEISEMRSKLDELRDQRASAIEEFDRAKEVELSDEINELRFQIHVAEQQAQAQAVALADYNETLSLNVQETRDKYPDLHDETSALYDEAGRERAWREVNDPGFFNTPDWPMRLAEEASRRIGARSAPQAEAPKEQKEATKTTTFPGQGEAPPTRPLGQVASGSNGVPSISPDDAFALVDSGDVDIEALLEELNRRDAVSAA